MTSNKTNFEYRPDRIVIFIIIIKVMIMFITITKITIL